MLSCKEVVKRSSEYVDGNLGFWGRVSFRFHLFMCVHCRRYIRHFNVAIGVSRECGNSTLTERQAEAIAQRVREQEK